MMALASSADSGDDMPNNSSRIARHLHRQASRQPRPGIARTLVLALAATIAATMPSGAQTSQSTRAETIQAVSSHFTSVPTMTGEFVQFGPNGEQTGGVFYIERPGRIRFNYEPPAAVEVVSNGSTVAVHNRKLDTWSFYPLDKTPLKLLLSERIEIDDETIRDVRVDPDLTTIVMGDDSVFGDAVITLMFDPQSYDLRQWTIKDSNGKETSVMVFNVEKNVDLPARLFKFDERAIRTRQQEQLGRSR